MGFETLSDTESLVTSDDEPSDKVEERRRQLWSWVSFGACVLLLLLLVVLLWHFVLSSVFGFVDTDSTATYEVLSKGHNYEIRRYAASTAIATTAGEDGIAFHSLAGYIGVMGSPQNVQAQHIAMTAPVVTTAGPGGEEMQFILPRNINSSAPQPTNQRVRLVTRSAAVLGVETFSGSWDMAAAERRAEALAQRLQADGYALKKNAPWQYFRYNPPWTIPAFRTNEVAVEIHDI